MMPYSGSICSRAQLLIASLLYCQHAWQGKFESYKSKVSHLRCPVLADTLSRRHVLSLNRIFGASMPSTAHATNTFIIKQVLKPTCVKCTQARSHEVARGVRGPEPDEPCTGKLLLLLGQACIISAHRLNSIPFEPFHAARKSRTAVTLRHLVMFKCRCGVCRPSTHSMLEVSRQACRWLHVKGFPCTQRRGTLCGLRSCPAQ